MKKFKYRVYINPQYIDIDAVSPDEAFLRAKVQLENCASSFIGECERLN
jgi:hypothetical protein